MDDISLAFAAGQGNFVQGHRVKEIVVSEKKTKIVMENHVHAVGSDTPALIYEMMFVYL